MSTCMRPVFRPPPNPPPTLLLRLYTFGSAAMMSATCFWWRTMSSKPMPCTASVFTVNLPWSSFGRKPFGISVNR